MDDNTDISSLSSDIPITNNSSLSSSFIDVPYDIYAAIKLDDGTTYTGKYSHAVAYNKLLEDYPNFSQSLELTYNGTITGAMTLGYMDTEGKWIERGEREL